MNFVEINSISKKVESWSAEQILQWAGERFAPKAVLTCSFGAGSVVLAHMLSRIDRDVPVLFLDTGYHFEETLQFRDAFVERFGLRFINQQPALTVTEQDAQYGPRLYERDPALCCRIRKTEPLANWTRADCYYPCTAPAQNGAERRGRKPGSGKTDRGFHTFTAKKRPTKRS